VSEGAHAADDLLRDEEDEADGQSAAFFLILLRMARP
jgi:hypothetical protein